LSGSEAHPAHPTSGYNSAWHEVAQGAMGTVEGSAPSDRGLGNGSEGDGT